MKRYLKLACVGLMSMVNFNSIGQIVTLEGKQFKIGANDFYPLVMNYNLGKTRSMDANNNLMFYVTPASSYGSTPDYECYDQNSCNLQLREHFAKIFLMGFNTIRVDLAVTYRYDASTDPANRLFSAFYDENLGPGNQYQSGYTPFDLDMTSGFTDPNSTNHFDIIKNLLTVAEQETLKVILVCGQGYRDPGGSRTMLMWQTYDSQAADDYATYLNRLATELQGYPSLMAFDLINEPIYQDMYKDGAGNTLNKETICDYVKRWTGAIRSVDEEYLITIGSSTIDEVFYFDPGVLDIDFYSPHLYTKGKPMYPDYDIPTDRGIMNGMNRYDIINYWMGRVYPMPWIMGETGFAADDNDTNVGLYPNHLDNDPDHHRPPWMFGSEAQQALFAQRSLNTTRNAGGSGYAWWAFQNVFWYDLNSAVEDYQEDFFGLLHFGDQVTNNWYEKDAVTVFETYLDLSGQPPAQIPMQEPQFYRDPFEIASLCQPCLNAGVEVIIVDQKGNEIEDAVISAKSGRWTDDWVLINDPTDDKYYHDNSFTFTQDNGTFNIYPLNHEQSGISNPHRIVSLEITAIGAEKRGFGTTWPYGDTPMSNNIGTQTIRKIVNGYDAVAKNEIVNADEIRNYYGRNTLTLTDMIMNGNSKVTAVNEIHINSEFHAHASTGNINNETHIFVSETAYPDCPVDFPGYLRETGTLPSSNESMVSQADNIELYFNAFENIKFRAEIIPNPSGGDVKFVISNPVNDPVIIQVLNLIGETVWTDKTYNTELHVNLEELTKGVYLVRFLSAQHAVIQKLILQ